MNKKALLLLLAGAALATLSLGWTLLQPVQEPMQQGEEAVSAARETSPPAKAPEAESKPEAPAAPKQAGEAAREEVSTPEEAAAPQPFIELSVVRVDPDGYAVIAGSSLPEAEIIISEGETSLVRSRADKNGEWVAIVPEPLSPGSHLLNLQMISPDGRQATADAAIVVEIAEKQPEAEKQTPLVALVPQDEKSVPKLIQTPDQPAAEPSAKPAGEEAETALMPENLPPRIQIRSLFWLEGERLRIIGAARGGAQIKARLANQASGSVQPDSQGSWSWLADISQLGDKTALLEADLLDASGTVLAQARLPLSAARIALGRDGSELVVIQKGDMLWRIAFRSYGKGVRYVDIVRANPGSIDDPDLIYPNQIFALPEKDGDS